MNKQWTAGVAGAVLGSLLTAWLMTGARAQGVGPPASSGDAVCAKPVLMTVIGQTLDRPKMLHYAAKLRDTGIYPRHDGYYVAAGKPVDIFEGPYPDNQSIIVARFPCLARARQFWYSSLYQDEMLPLRTGAGAFAVAVYDELPRP
jgi:uncharacterized protein (DUF1330 family)